MLISIKLMTTMIKLSIKYINKINKKEPKKEKDLNNKVLRKLLTPLSFLTTDFNLAKNWIKLTVMIKIMDFLLLVNCLKNMRSLLLWGTIRFLKKTNYNKNKIIVIRMKNKIAVRKELAKDSENS